MQKLKVAVLISGRGSNLAALIDAARAPGFPAAIILVVSNVADAQGLVRAQEAGIPTCVVDHRAYAGREPFEDALHDVISASGAELVCLAGFMRLLTAGFVERWHDRLINIHPSLLPAFRGLCTHERALTEGVRFSGCTVHFVRPGMDDGPIIAQAVVPVHPDDVAFTLAARILAEEHRLYPLAVRLIAEGRTHVVGGRVDCDDVAVPETSLLNPLPDA